MSSDDAAEVAALCEQLGYPATLTQITHRFGLLMEQPEQGLFVLEAQDERVIGWIHVCGRFLLEADPYAEVCGLIVDEQLREHGAGRALIAEAEAWARARGYDEMRLRSNIARDPAHAFYQQLGYRLDATSYLFRKTLEEA